MPASDAVGARVDALETRIMQQDQIIEDLNATVTAQWRLLDALTRQLAALEDRLREFDEARMPATEAPPPHY